MSSHSFTCFVSNMQDLACFANVSSRFAPSVCYAFIDTKVCILTHFVDYPLLDRLLSTPRSSKWSLLWGVSPDSNFIYIFDVSCTVVHDPPFHPSHYRSCIKMIQIKFVGMLLECSRGHCYSFEME
jgi:hypothetical protein